MHYPINSRKKIIRIKKLNGIVKHYDTRVTLLKRLLPKKKQDPLFNFLTLISSFFVKLHVLFHDKKCNYKVKIFSKMKVIKEDRSV